ncbi:Chaperone protein htpG [Candidatus Clavichlamydia salmonicola]|uniref:molecular chaperone HtpG n=1 Tax=Candidatus Clavichlamydia salmonicola TaxID=469812 RepID=UPI001890F442|nr:molecular chaperone HtpG [Candidatus Clavichlamydia salmonicola]MBF5050521.1 Chaperone protein htpG [Candidatus Clavichlamydia salmonicola]
MKTGSLYIDIENILPIIKKHLYAEHDIFIRELVSNSCDAIGKLNRLMRNGESDSQESEFYIKISINSKEKTIAFSDNGLGMTGDEVEKYIGQIAFSGAKEFIEKYGQGAEDSGIIGHFGLGFFSTYMVAEHVEIITLSHQNNSTAVKWQCDGSSQYTLTDDERDTHGTDVILHLSPDASEYLESSKVQAVLEKFCKFLPHSIYLDGLLINKEQPLWLKNPADVSDLEYIEFYRANFSAKEDPILWVHLNMDYPFSLKGILYFPKDLSARSSKSDGINIYSHRVFVSNEGNVLLPDYLKIIQGMVDFQDLPLDVSRSSIRHNSNVKQLATHITKKIIDKLLQQYSIDRNHYIEIWKIISMIIKIGLLENPKLYDRLKDILLWKNQSGEWSSLEQYLEKKGDKIIYYTAENINNLFLNELYEKKNIEVLIGASHIVETAIMGMLEKKLNVSFYRIDAMTDQIISSKQGKDLFLQADGNPFANSTSVENLFTKVLTKKSLKINSEELSSDNLPALLVINEEERRRRELIHTFKMQGADVEEENNNQLQESQLILNSNNPLIKNIINFKDNSELTELLVKEIYDLTALSQGEETLEGVELFLKRTMKLLELLIKK